MNSAVLGAIAMTVLLIGYHWLVARSLLSDGQYFFFVAITVPSGAAAGLGTFALTSATHSDSKRRSSMRAIINGLATLALPVMYCVMTADNSANLSHGAMTAFLETAVALLPMYLWGFILICAGFYRARYSK